MRRSIPITCQKCEKLIPKTPVLVCGHFICAECYQNVKSNRPNQQSNKCGCPTCGRNMARRYRN